MKCIIEFHDNVLYLEYNITSLAELDQLICLLEGSRGLFGGSANLNLCKNNYGRELGKKGGEARAAKLTPERRSEIAKHAAKKRWSRIKVNDNTVLGYD